MRRLYLGPDGTEHIPPDQTGGHYAIASAYLSRAGLPVGDADDCYIAMWSRGFVRVLDQGDQVVAERYANGRPCGLEDLTEAQQAFFQRLRAAGRRIVFKGRENEH